MADKVRCPQCGINIEYPEELSGQLVDCPKCSQPITIPCKTTHATNANSGSLKRFTVPIRKKIEKPTFCIILDMFSYLSIASSIVPLLLMSELGPSALIIVVICCINGFIWMALSSFCYKVMDSLDQIIFNTEQIHNRLD